MLLALYVDRDLMVGSAHAFPSLRSTAHDSRLGAGPLVADRVVRSIREIPANITDDGPMPPSLAETEGNQMTWSYH